MTTKKSIDYTSDRLDKFGHEVLDPTPFAPNITNRRLNSEADRIRGIIRGEQLREAMRAAGAETFEEADDFEVGEDWEPDSPYEEIFDPAAAQAARDKPLPTKPTEDASPSEEDAKDGGVQPERIKNVSVDNRSYTGKGLRDLVSWLKRLPDDELEKLAPLPSEK